jgi:alpha-amylase/alpha-mannosidase (GH57 family)
MGTYQFCVHGHFYQPPREDPLTNEIPAEPGAHPFANWNERINDQCYRPNALLGNFEHISFNIGPTLVKWLEESDPETLARIVEQDQSNLKQYGVSSAMAQGYNHTILPLSNREDKRTQVKWGIRSYEHLFQHKPEGLWLPETAVDLETLEILAECGIKFTILAPWQAVADHLDVTQPYRVELRDGQQMIVFFYHPELSTRISFDPGSTVNADAFVLEHLLPKFRVEIRKPSENQLLLIASDGELYGHHQPFRDKFLAHLVNGAITGKKIKKTFPALWLLENQPRKAIQIHENTSWSCHHGVKRWSQPCDCTPNGNWKEPLRKALNFIASEIDLVYLETCIPFIQDPWKLRNEYIEVILGRVTATDLIQANLIQPLEEGLLEKISILLLAQYERQRMFTSCGWFFDDFDRIEPRNNVAYAAQAVWLCYLASGVDISPRAKPFLRAVKSWRSGLRADIVFIHHMERSRAFHETRKWTPDQPFKASNKRETW